MQIIQVDDNLCSSDHPNVAVTIGSFDAIHLGHRKLIQETRSLAKKYELASALITFSVHPRKIVSSDKTGQTVYPMPYRLELIEKCGVDLVFIIEFNQKFSEQSPEEFINSFLINQIGTKCLVIGSDFRFGKNRQGSILDLNLNKDKFLEIKTVEFERTLDEEISTTKIREYIAMGEMIKANQLLGAPYTISGQVVFGDGRGKIIGVPTANLIPNMEVIPKKGVYATNTIINKITYKSITNIGTKPTFNSEDNISIETHIFNFDAPIHNNEIYIKFFEFIRPEQKFSSTNHLVEQIRLDIIKAQKILKG